MTEYSQGIMEDGAVILCNGQPMTPEEIVRQLNAYHQAKPTISREKISEILKRWHSTISTTDHQIEQLRNFFNCGECDFIDAIDDLQNEYTLAIGKQIGDISANWLLWYWLENQMGKSALRAGRNRILKPVTNLLELEELITEVVGWVEQSETQHPGLND